MLPAYIFSSVNRSATTYDPAHPTAPILGIISGYGSLKIYYLIKGIFSQPPTHSTKKQILKTRFIRQGLAKEETDKHKYDRRVSMITIRI